MQFKDSLLNYINLEKHKRGQLHNQKGKSELEFRTRDTHAFIAQLAKEISLQYSQKDAHKVRVEQYFKYFPKFNLNKFDIVQKSQQNNTLLQQAVTNVYTGLSSEFLRLRLKEIQDDDHKKSSSLGKKLESVAANENVKMILAGRFQIYDKVLKDAKSNVGKDAKKD